MAETTQPVLPSGPPEPLLGETPGHAAATETHASTEAAHGEGGGLPQFEFQHWAGQIVYLLFLFAILYWLMSRVFVPRLRSVIAHRAATISDAVASARLVQAEAAAQAEVAKAEVVEARSQSRAMASAAKARVTDDANRRAAEEEAVVNARIAEAETAIGKTRDAAMTNVSTIAADTAAAMVERLTGKAPTGVEATAAVKGAA